MSKGWHNKHISTKAGIIIIVVFILATGLLVSFLDKTQVINTNAYYTINEGGLGGSRSGCSNKLNSHNPKDCWCSDKVGCKNPLVCKYNSYRGYNTCSNR